MVFRRSLVGGEAMADDLELGKVLGFGRKQLGVMDEGEAVFPQLRK